jgi:urease accessory protein
MSKISQFVLAASLIFLASAPAFAHPGHGPEPSFMTGFLHPLSGLDHILATIATGALALRLGFRATWAIPLAFVTMLCVGGVLGASGAEVPAVEQGIAASVLVLGVVVALGARLSLWFAIPLVGSFAMFHGLAHGAEGGANGTGPGLEYFAGFLLATAVLIGAGILSAAALSGSRHGAGLQRIAGSAVALAGLALLAS